MSEETLHRQNIVACIWDFDRTLIPGYMQRPLFRHFDVDEKTFWKEVNTLPEFFRKKGQRVSGETVYLNHLLTYVRAGIFKGLNNALLKELGADLDFFPGLPDFLQTLKDLARSRPDYRKHDITLEHYIISTGLAEMIRGSRIAPFVDNIYGCELIEAPPPPGYLKQPEFFDDGLSREVTQIGFMVDNTIKTRFIFEINKGTNKNPDIDVNARLAPEDRRVPIKNMIYIADGPSDVPVFSVVRKSGGRAYAVYESGNEAEFVQNDALLRSGRVDSYGRADYRQKSDTHMWLKTHVLQICDRIVREQEFAVSQRVTKPPRHIQDEPAPPEEPPRQSTFLEE
jgi:hypothetical protein